SLIPGSLPGFGPDTGRGGHDGLSVAEGKADTVIRYLRKPVETSHATSLLFILFRLPNYSPTVSAVTPFFRLRSFRPIRMSATPISPAESSQWSLLKHTSVTMLCIRASGEEAASLTAVIS